MRPYPSFPALPHHFSDSSAPRSAPPTSNNNKRQQTVDYPAKADADLVIKGRHDPCIVPRAAVVQNTLTAFGLLDLLTVRYGTLAQKHGLPKA